MLADVNLRREPDNGDSELGLLAILDGLHDVPRIAGAESGVEDQDFAVTVGGNLREEAVDEIQSVLKRSVAGALQLPHESFDLGLGAASELRESVGNAVLDGHEAHVA